MHFTYVLKFTCLTCLINNFYARSSAASTSPNNVETKTTKIPPENNKNITTTPAPKNTLPSNSAEKKISEHRLWYGAEKNIQEILGCAWPSDFEKRISFCANRTGVTKPFNLGNGSEAAEFGVLSKEIADHYMQTHVKNENRTEANDTELIDRTNLWWEHIENITDFKTCLKKNTEGMVHLCAGDDEFGQTVSGIAGLHLSVMDILIESHKHLGDESHACKAKLSEALHVTGALYLSANFYSKNTVLCWDIVTKGKCDDTCREFANILTCLQSACSDLAKTFSSIGVWEWYFNNVARAKRACNVQLDDASCKSHTIAPISITPAPNDFVSKGKQLFENVKDKFRGFANGVEHYTHLPFYAVTLIFVGVLIIFTVLIVLLCLCCQGELCQNRNKGTLRYSKLIPGEKGTHAEESRSLTTHCDDLE